MSDNKYSTMSNAELETWLRHANRENDTERARSLTAELNARFAESK